MNETIISAYARNLTFQTNDGPVHALADVNLEIGQGACFSFIGSSAWQRSRVKPGTTLYDQQASLRPATDGHF